MSREFGNIDPDGFEPFPTLSEELMVRWRVFRGLPLVEGDGGADAAATTMHPQLVEVAGVYKHGLEAAGNPICNDALARYGLTENIDLTEIGRFAAEPGYRLRWQDIGNMRFSSRQAILYVEDVAALYLDGEIIWDLRDEKDRVPEQTISWEADLDRWLPDVTIGQPWSLNEYVEFPPITGVEVRVQTVYKSKMNENALALPELGTSPFFMARMIRDMNQSDAL